MLHAASAPQQPPARRRLLGITGRGGRELLDTEQPADRVEGGGDMHVRVGVQAAGDGAGVYAMVTVIPSQVDGWHAPLAARTRESWPLAPLARARQIRPSAAPTNWRSLAFVMSQPPMTFLTAGRPDRARLENCRAPDTRRTKHGLETRSLALSWSQRRIVTKQVLTAGASTKGSVNWSRPSMGSVVTSYQPNAVAAKRPWCARPAHRRGR